jgi:hypothetical protein
MILGGMGRRSSITYNRMGVGSMTDEEVETAWRGRVGRMTDLLEHVSQPETNRASPGPGG